MKNTSRCNRSLSDYYQFFYLFLYTCLFYYISSIHCRWFDELQAWSIAKDVTFNSLFSTLKFEGHPFLWYLLLSGPAKIFSIKSFTVISTCIYSFTAYMILFRSPFPLVIKLLIPLNYFVFYQYGVVARSYSLFVLVALLCAQFYRERFVRPWFLIFVALLSSISFHSMLMSCAIILAYTVEATVITLSSKKICRDQIKCYINIILCICFFIFNVYSIILPEDQFFLQHMKSNIIDFHRIYAIFTEPMLQNISFWANQFTDPTENWFQIKDLLFLAISFCVFIYLTAVSCSWPTAMYVFLPILALEFGLLFLYANVYHFGLTIPPLLFSFWITYKHRDHIGNLFILKSIVLAVVVVGVFYNAKAINVDMNFCYSGAKDAAEYIIANKIEGIATDSINALGVNAYVGKNIFNNVRDKPYFIWSKDGNILLSKKFGRFILTNNINDYPREFYRIVKQFPGHIHSKGKIVSHDDDFVLYERRLH